AGPLRAAAQSRLRARAARSRSVARVPRRASERVRRRAAPQQRERRSAARVSTATAPDIALVRERDSAARQALPDERHGRASSLPRARADGALADRAAGGGGAAVAPRRVRRSRSLRRTVLAGVVRGRRL